MSRSHVLLVVLALASGVVMARQAEISKDDRALYKQMLRDLRKDLEDNYYDKRFRGIDLAQLFDTASANVAAATTTAEAVDIISGTLSRFDDSHTRFIPPQRAIRVEYGWTMGAVADKPLVLRVDPGSDAAKCGLAPGDQVLAVNRFRPTRDNLWQIQHYYGVVRPQVQQRLVVRKPDGSERTLDVKSKTESRPVVQVSDAIDEAVDEALREADVTRRLEPDILIWRMTAFRDSDEIAPFIGKARDARALVLDLRGNEGGFLDGLKALVGWMFDRDVHVMTRTGRKGEKREVAKRRNKPFLGKLVILVDSRSASAAECFARVAQLEKRGTVLGDRTAGKVMTSETIAHSFGLGVQTYYGLSVTVSDTLMSDGAGLENVGVVPDELLLPTPADLAAGRDPVLARAVAILGGSLTADQAGQLLPSRPEATSPSPSCSSIP